MPDTTIQHLRELLGSASARPWRVKVVDEVGHREILILDADDYVVFSEILTTPNQHRDAALIVALVNAAPALLDVAEASKRRRAQSADWGWEAFDAALAALEGIR